MRLTRRSALGIALACATLAAVLAYFYLLSLRPKPVDKSLEVSQVSVVVPIAEIAAYSVITEDMVVRKKVEAEDAPKAPVGSVADVVGNVALATLPAGEPIAGNQIMARGAALGLAGMVPTGMRAMTVGLDPVMGVAGLLKPGDRVDVVATFEIGDTVIGRTILQDIELLALGRQMVAVREKPMLVPKVAGGGESEDEEKPRAPKTEEQPNATLAVTPEDAQRLTLADQQGNLRLALRPVGEHDIVPVSSTDLVAVAGPEYVKLRAEAAASIDEMMRRAAEEKQGAGRPEAVMYPPFADAPTRKEPSEKKPREVEVIRGGDREKVVP